MRSLTQGECSDDGRLRAIAGGQLDDAALVRQHRLADDVDAEAAEHRGVGVHALGVVVVAGDDDGRDAGADELADEVEKDSLGLRRRHGGVEDVAGHEHGVDALVFRDGEHLFERSDVFRIALLVTERLADVPVRRVQEAHD